MTVLQFEHAVKQTDFILALGNFIDAFSYTKNKQTILDGSLNANSLTRRERALFAATLETLCNKYNLSAPSWIDGDEFKLKEPYYQFDTQDPEYREYLKNAAPIEFSKRNLFFDSNCIARV